MKKLFFACIALAFTVSGGQTLRANPVSFTATLTTDSTATILISMIQGATTASTAVDISGTIDVTIDSGLDTFAIAASGTSSTISLDDSEIELSDESLLVSLGLWGAFEFQTLGMGINGLSTNGPIALTPTGSIDPFPYTFDPGAGAPTELNIDEGLLSYVGSGSLGSQIGSGNFSYSTDPINATLASAGQVGLLTQDVTIAGNTIVVDVLISAPLDFAYTIDPPDLGMVDLEFSGVIVATGNYTTIVPEPSSAVLLGLAVVGLIPLWRRVFR